MICNFPIVYGSRAAHSICTDRTDRQPVKPPSHWYTGENILSPLNEMQFSDRVRIESSTFNRTNSTDRQDKFSNWIRLCVLDNPPVSRRIAKRNPYPYRKEKEIRKLIFSCRFIMAWVLLVGAYAWAQRRSHARFMVTIFLLISWQTFTLSLFSVFTSHVMKTKNRNHSMN